MHLQACANIIGHTCISSNGQSGSSMWDGQNRIRAILTGKVGHVTVSGCTSNLSAQSTCL